MLRSLVRRRSHSLAVVAGLSTGLTVSIATFSALTSIVYGEQPGITDRSDLVQVTLSEAGTPRSLSLDDFATIRDAGPALGELAAEGPLSLAAVGRHDAIGVPGAFVSGNYFAVLGTRANAGRLLTAADERTGAPPVAVVSEHFFRTQLDGRPDAIGAPILIAGRSFTVVGVTQPRFHGLEPLEPGQSDAYGLQVWLPLSFARGWPAAPAAADPWMRSIGRLRPGFTAEDARAQSGVPAARLAALSPPTRGTTAIVIRGKGFGPNDTPVEILLVIAAMLSVPLTVLLIACANVANLQLARAAERSRELAVRSALGASRFQLVRLLTTEALALSAVAVGVSALATTAIIRLTAPYFPFAVSLDWRVVMFSVVLMFGVTLLTGLAPARLVLRRRGAMELKQSAQAGGLGHSRLRASLVAAQVALSLVMLCATGVFLRSVRAMELEAPAALKSQLVAEFDYGQIGGSDADARQFAADLRARLEGHPRVTSVALSRERSVRYGAPDGDASSNRFVAYLEVSPSWFALMDVPPLSGRLLTATDAADAVVVSARLAEAVAPGGSAIGRALQVAERNGPGRLVQIVGVVADHRTRPMAIGDRPDPVVYASLSSSWPGTFAVRVGTPDPDGFTSDFRTIVRDLEPRLPWLSLRRGEERYLEDAGSLKYLALSVGTLGLLALLLAAAGLYAVMAYVVQLRRREIGVRMALGANPRRITMMVLRQAFTLVAIGAAVGLGLALPLAFFLRSVFLGTVPVGDPGAFLPPIGALLASALVAAALPALRAARVNPIQVLRDE